MKKRTVIEIKKAFEEKFKPDGPACGCFINDGDGETCVWDEGEPDECSVAASGVKRDSCEFWQIARHNNYIDYDDVIEWLDEELKE